MKIWQLEAVKVYDRHNGVTSPWKNLPYVCDAAFFVWFHTLYQTSQYIWVLCSQVDGQQVLSHSSYRADRNLVDFHARSW